MIEFIVSSISKIATDGHGWFWGEWATHFRYASHIWNYFFQLFLSTSFYGLM